MTSTRRRVIGLVAFTAICIATLLYLFTLAGGRLRLNEPYNAKALVPDTFNIVQNSDVRRDGVLVGRVRSVEPSNGSGLVKFEMEKAAGRPLYRDATVRVRTKTLVGESYLEVDPGTPAAGKLPSGSTLPVAAAQEATPLERILNSLDEPTRNEIRRNLKGIGVGLDGHEKDLNEFFGAMKPTTADGGRLMAVLAPQRQRLAALIGNTGKVMQAFGDRTADLRSLVVDAKATAEAAASRDAQLREAIDELPATLNQVQKSVNTLGSFSGRATPVFRNLKLASADLAPAVRDLGPAARDARTLFKELTPFLKAIDPALTQLKPATASLTKIVNPLDGFLRQAIPFAQYMARYSRDAGTFFANVGSLFGAKDALGTHVGRVFPMYGENQFVDLTDTQRKLLDSLIKAGGFDKLHKTQLNSFPKPGTAGNPQPFDGHYDRVEALPAK
jgi:phospholipid/cholesterol/gamma-HCH transport system substrate-binding protein